MASELESHLQETVYWGRKKLVNFKAGKPNLFCLSGLLTLVLFDVKRDGYLLEENLYFEIFWDYLSLLNYIDAFTLSLLLKLSPKKLEPWFVLWHVFLLRLLFISINLLFSLKRNNVPSSWLVFLAATWSFTSSLSSIFDWSLKCIQPESFLLFSINLVDIQMNQFLCLILVGSPLFILIGCINYQLLFLNVIRMSLSKMSFLSQPDIGTLCL